MYYGLVRYPVRVGQCRYGTDYAADLLSPRLDHDHIVFRGAQDESAGQVLTGSILLHTPKQLARCHVQLRLVADFESVARTVPRWRKVFSLGFIVPKITTSGTSVLQQFSLATRGQSSGDVVLPNGRHEYPFEVPVAGNMIESIEGLPELSLKYRMEVIVRNGNRAILRADKHLRIIRTAGPNAVESYQTESVRGTWKGKVNYHIAIPQKLATFGGVIQVNVLVAALLPGVEQVSVTFKVIEHRKSWVASGSGVVHHNCVARKVAERRVSDIECVEPFAAVANGPGTRNWALSVPLLLPGSLKHCGQDLDLDMIKIEHMVKTIIILNNADGHQSEVSVRACA